MRHDMTKVFHEPGRRGCTINKGNQRDLQRDPTELPTRQSMHRDWDRGRDEAYSPLRRYLRSQVGRRWDAVYSDICHVTKVGSLPHKELLDALDWMVEQHVQIIDGQPHDEHGHKISGDFAPIWIHPETGIVMKSPGRPRRRYKHRTHFKQFAIDDSHKLVLVNDLWFAVNFTTVPESWPDIPERDIPRDILLHEPALRSSVGKFKREWGADIYAISKRSANSREIKRITL